MVCHAQSLAFRAVASWRWRPVGVHVMVDGHAYATLARGPSDGRDWPTVPGPFQVVPHPRGRSSVGRAAICGAELVAGQPGAGGPCVAMVESLASRSRRQGGTSRRGPRGSFSTLATTRSISTNRSGTRGIAAVGGARRPVWRGIVAGTNGEATGVAIHVARSRSAVEITTPGIDLKTPDPFIPQAIYALAEALQCQS